MPVFNDSIILHIISGAKKLNVIKQKIKADTKIFTLLHLAHTVKKTFKRYSLMKN